jgi:hypothetical protein
MIQHGYKSFVNAIAKLGISYIHTAIYEKKDVIVATEYPRLIACG